MVKLLQLIIILGIFLKGHKVLGIKLSSNYHSNRKLLVKGGDAAPDINYVLFSEACSVTMIAKGKAAWAFSCGGSLSYCVEPKEAKCAAATAAEGNGTAMANDTVYVFAVKDAIEPATGPTAAACVAVGFGDDAKMGAKTQCKVTVVEGAADQVNITSSEDGKELCPGDNGGALVCNNALAGIIVGVNACGKTGNALKVSALVEIGGDGGIADSEGEKSTPAPGGGSYAITSSIIASIFPIIIVTCSV